MGILRFVLAILVVFSHLDYFNPHIMAEVGALSVRLFYLISGFYIQLIIAQYDSQQNWIRKFYFSRLLRLFPCYFLILIATIIFNGTSCNVYCQSMVINNSVFSLIYYYLSNMFIIGQSVGRFLVYHFATGDFSFDSTHPIKMYWVSNIHLLPQAWSIAIELNFYLFAPFILKIRSKFVWSVIIISFATKILLAITGHNSYANWYNAFFPAEFHTFLLGAMAARLLNNQEILQKYKKYLVALGAIFFAAYCVNQQFLLIVNTGELLVVSICCLLPFIFLMSKNSLIDKYVGYLSYPIYLNHILIINFFASYSDKITHVYKSIFLSVFMAIMMVVFIEMPITKFRHKMFRNKKLAVL